MSKQIKGIICCIVLCACFFSVEPHRRTPPSSMSHSEQEFKDYITEKEVKCTYISNGHKFAGNVYIVGDGGRIKIGTSVITFQDGYYTLSFKSESFKSRDASSQYNIWTYEKMFKDFSQSGRYITFYQGNNYYLRMYDRDTYSDIKLSGKAATGFVLTEDELCFEYQLH